MPALRIWRCLRGLPVALSVLGCGLAESGDYTGPGDVDGQAAQDARGADAATGATDSAGTPGESSAVTGDSTASGDSSEEDAPPERMDASSADSSLVDSSVVDSGAKDSTVIDSSAADTTVTVLDSGAADTAQPDASCGSCTLQAPANWSLVAFASSTSASCPSGFGTVDVVENASPGTACTCGTDCQASANCTQIQIPTTFGNSCQDVGAAYNPPNTSCNGFNSTFGGPSCGIGSVSVSVPTSQCTGPSPTADSSGIVATRDRICQPSGATCPSMACGPAITSPFETCIVTTGDVPCPPSAPTKHTVGTPSLTCGTCPCTATVACAGTFTFYSQAGCSGNSLAIPMGQCVPVQNGDPIHSYEWSPSTPTTTCQVASPAGASVTLNNEATVCCP